MKNGKLINIDRVCNLMSFYNEINEQKKSFINISGNYKVITL